jgi:hypothetical protein
MLRFTPLHFRSGGHTLRDANLHVHSSASISNNISDNMGVISMII